MTAGNEDRVLAFAPIGDLHLTDAKQRNFTDFLTIVAQIEIEGARTLDFVVLPGDMPTTASGPSTFWPRRH